MIKHFLYFSLVFLFLSCSNKTYLPQGVYDNKSQPDAPEYSDLYYWAAHPEKSDNADRTPKKSPYQDNQKEAKADVFFIYPTIYTGDKKGQDQWNAPVNDDDFNEQVDNSTILNQASIFNGAGRVFAPRYRQAHIHSYYTKDLDAKKKAFGLAYNDVKNAFEYYLEHYNNGRPIIIASHSQGTTHAGPLMKEFFDGKDLYQQLVAAYVVGIEVPADYFEQIKPCTSAEETGCFCSWRTWEKDYLPKSHDPNNNYVVTNPLNWKIDDSYASIDMNKGSVLYNFDKGCKNGVCDAQGHQGILWVNKPRFFGSRLVKMRNYHIGDFNLFYANVRENAILRLEKFLEKQ